MQGIVTEEIRKNEVGEVKVDGKKWSAIADNKIEVGSIVKILKINGVKLKVEVWKE
jgi:membrane protein implicated in regulation of membrane protease activity